MDLNWTRLAVAAAGGAALALWFRVGRPAGGFSHSGNASSFVPLNADELPADPYDLLESWMADAEKASGFLEAHAMTLATSDSDGGATARTVVLQLAGEEHGGLVFGSNRFSLKARQATADSRVEAVLRFGQRQARVRGTLRIDDTKAAVSFGRVAPRARLGLTTLEQGHATDEAGHAKVVAQIDELMAKGHEQNIAEPPSNYTAFVLTPKSFEFYNGGHPAYINDRFLYLRASGGTGFATPLRLQA